MDIHPRLEGYLGSRMTLLDSAPVAPLFALGFCRIISGSHRGPTHDLSRIMESKGGTCEVQMPGLSPWVTHGPGRLEVGKSG
eukprot:s510_g27.t1